jgi:hypothetical protein
MYKKIIFLLGILLLLISVQCSVDSERSGELNIQDIEQQLSPSEYQIIKTQVDSGIRSVKQFFYYMSIIPEKYRGYLLYLSVTEQIPLNIIAVVPVLESGWNSNCVYVNRNGSVDRGIIQINSMYQDWYIQEFWDKPYDFDVWNPYHNFYLGYQEIKWAYDLLGDWKLAVMSYNCGIGTVLNNRVPEITMRYTRRVFQEPVW